MSKIIRRVGVLTGGGDCPGLNAVIRAVSKSLILRCNAEVIGFEDGFLGLIEQRCRVLNYEDVSGILTRGGTILGTSNKANPFSYYRDENKDVSAKVKTYYDELGLDAIVVIGGDGTMSISNRLADLGMNIVGVPKTIDNDLVGTDRTFGFDTAVSIATEALDRVHTTAHSHRRVLIVETMGRYAGWIALHAGVASGSDIILIPEIPYELESIVEVCRKRENNQRYTIIAVAEGAVPAGGSMTVRETVSTSPDPLRLGGVSNVLAAQLKEHLDSEVRTTILGHVQRGGTPTAFDRVLSTGFGAEAARMVENGKFGRMVTFTNNSMDSIALSEVADKVRTVKRTSPAIAAALAVGTSFGVRDIYTDETDRLDSSI